MVEADRRCRALGREAELRPEPVPQTLAAPADLGRESVDPDQATAADDPVPGPRHLRIHRGPRRVPAGEQRVRQLEAARPRRDFGQLSSVTAGCGTIRSVSMSWARNPAMLSPATLLGRCGLATSHTAVPCVKVRIHSCYVSGWGASKPPFVLRVEKVEVDSCATSSHSRQALLRSPPKPDGQADVAGRGA